MIQSRKKRILNLWARSSAVIDLSNVLYQASIALDRSDDRCGMTGFQRAPGHFLKQPRAERIELIHIGHIDFQILGLLQLWRDVVEQTFKRRSVCSRPGPTWTEFQRIAVACRSQKGD